MSKILTSTFAFAATVGLALTMSTTSVSANEDLIAEGKIIFEETAGGVGCASCHGMDGSGDIGPDIRGYDDLDVSAAFNSVFEMQFLRGDIGPGSRKMKAVGAYIESLG